MNQIGSMSIDNDPNIRKHNNNATKEQYAQYSWLFGKKR